MYEIKLLSTTVATNCSGDFEANKHTNVFNTMTDMNFIRGLIHKQSHSQVTFNLVKVLKPINISFIDMSSI